MSIQAGRPWFLKDLFNMFPEPLDAELVARLDAIKDTEPQLYFTLHPILDAANTLRIGEWRVAYWSVYASLVCTFGTALVGTSTAILSFTHNDLATKGVSILVAFLGAVLSLLKGTGLPETAFTDYNKANDIIDRIRDVFSNPDSQPAPDPNSGTDTAPGPDGGAPAPDTNGGGVTASGAPPVSASGLIIDWDAIENIKADWRQMRDDNIRARGMTLMALQGGVANLRKGRSKTTKDSAKPADKPKKGKDDSKGTDEKGSGGTDEKGKGGDEKKGDEKKGGGGNDETGQKDMDEKGVAGPGAENMV